MRYGQVVGLAERHFAAIRQSVAMQAAPATLKAAFLEPVARDLATQLSVHLFARTDAHFMGWFTCEPPPAVHAQGFKTLLNLSCVCVVTLAFAPPVAGQMTNVWRM